MRVPGGVNYSARYDDRLFLFPGAEQQQAFLSNPQEFADRDLALKGDCAVCLVHHNKRVAGKPEFTEIRDGLRYLFVSAREQAAFRKDPSLYIAPASKPTAMESQTSQRTEENGSLTVTGKTTCAGCEHGVAPIENPEELGLAVNSDDGKVVIVEQAHKLYRSAVRQPLLRRTRARERPRHQTAGPLHVDRAHRADGPEVNLTRPRRVHRPKCRRLARGRTLSGGCFAMRSPLRLLILVVALVFAGPVLPNAKAGDVPPIVAISSNLAHTSDRLGQLSVTAKIANGFHIYALSQPRPFLATRITVPESPAVRVSGAFTPSRPPKIVKHPTLGVELHEYEGQITWTAPIEFSAPLGADLVVQGTVFVQACQEDRCLAPRTYEFKSSLHTEPVSSPRRSDQVVQVGGADASKSVAVAPVSAGAGASTEARPPADRGPSSGSFSLDRIEVAVAESGRDSVWTILPLAFLAGFLLNLMPCVLPVVGLKLLSFVQQSSDSRRRVLLLNVAYSAGLMSVMLVLATFAVFAGLGWGEQFTSTTFSVTLAAIVFGFGLSFLGVWEVPMPGFVGTAGGSAGEGYGGEFSKGVLSTLLATPCSGPFLGSALAWAIVRPAYLTYAVFACVALGMASPYLLIGLFPRLARLLPRPGNWMVTFKQMMGFVLLATVVYLLSFIPAPSVVPTVLVLLSVGFGSWWVGRVLPLESRGRRLRAWAVAVGSIVAAAWLSFGWLEDVMARRFDRALEQQLIAIADSSRPAAVLRHRDLDGIAWEPFSKRRLEELVNGGKTVFVDFTADWCLTCMANEAAAIERPEVARLIRENGVVALKADKTKPAPEVDETLRRLGNKAASIPFYAIFPSNPARKPVLLDGLLTSPEPIVQAVRQAGPSLGAKVPDAARSTEHTRVKSSERHRMHALGPPNVVAAHDISCRRSDFLASDPSASRKAIAPGCPMGWVCDQYLPRDPVWHGACNSASRVVRVAGRMRPIQGAQAAQGRHRLLRSRAQLPRGDLVRGLQTDASRWAVAVHFP